MFNTEAIICSENGVWTARACCPTVQKAESVRAGFIGPVPDQYVRRSLSGGKRSRDRRA